MNTIDEWKLNAQIPIHLLLVSHDFPNAFKETSEEKLGEYGSINISFYLNAYPKINLILLSNCPALKVTNCPTV